jgi:tetratricopeptide (TPR) repeat protein
MKGDGMFLLLPMLVLVAPHAAQRPIAVAMVLEVSDEAACRRAQKPDEKAALEEAHLLYPGDRIEVRRGTVLVIYLGAEHYERAAAGAEFTVTEKGGAPAQQVQKLPAKPTAANLEYLRELARNSRGAVAVFRSDPDKDPPAVQPIHASRVLTTRPRLAWPAVPQAARYEVRLFDLNNDRPIWKTESAKNFLAEPKEDLPIGMTRIWRVTALDQEGKLVGTLESRFTVASQEEIDGVADLRKLSASREPRDWLLAALAYESLGAANEALATYQQLAEAQPKPTYWAALAHYYARAGLKDKAEEARKKLKEMRK